MRWWLLSALFAVVLAEGLFFINWPVLGVKFPITWLAIYFIVSNEWVGWRQGLAVAALSGYVLDVLASPSPGYVLAPMLLVFMISIYVLKRYEYSRDSKVAALAAGTTIYLGGSLATGPYLPTWLNGLILLTLYLLLSAAVYVFINFAIKFWLSRV